MERARPRSSRSTFASTRCRAREAAELLTAYLTVGRKKLDPARVRAAARRAGRRPIRASPPPARPLGPRRAPAGAAVRVWTVESPPDIAAAPHDRGRVDGLIIDYPENR